MRTLTGALTFAVFSLPIVGFAQPPAWTEVNGNVVLLRANTNSTRYSCNYLINVTFKDGTSTNASGQTDPATNATNHVAAQWTYQKQVSSANLARWDCRQTS